MMIQISGLFQAASPARPGHRVSLGSPGVARLCYSGRPSLSLPSLRPAFSGDRSSLHHGQGIR